MPVLYSGGMFKDYDLHKFGVAVNSNRRYGCIVFELLAEQICHGSSEKECRIEIYPPKTLARLSMTFTTDGKRQRLPLIIYSFLVIFK